MLRLLSDENFDNHIAQAIDEMLLVVQCSTENHWDDSITYFPLA